MVALEGQPSHEPLPEETLLPLGELLLLLGHPHFSLLLVLLHVLDVHFLGNLQVVEFTESVGVLHCSLGPGILFICCLGLGGLEIEVPLVRKHVLDKEHFFSQLALDQLADVAGVEFA